MREFMKMIGQSISDVRHSTMVNTQKISKLEIQVGQLASHLGERDKGKLLSQPVNNPKACTIGSSSTQEHAHAIVTLKSGRRVDNHVAQPEADREAEPTTDLERQEEKESDKKETTDVEPSTVTPMDNDRPRSFVPKAPYPERLRAPKRNAQFAEILEVFKQVQINITFLCNSASAILCEIFEGFGHNQEKNQCPKESLSDRASELHPPMQAANQV
jgi:hypothetical protein